MKVFNGVVLIVLFLLLLAPKYSYVCAVSGERKSDNIVLITVNQLGIRDLNKYWEYLKNIRGLAEVGTRFSRVYSQLYTTSSRSALLTGRLPVKTGMLKGRFLPFTSLPSIASSGGLPLSEQTLAEILKENGYTSKYIGLWDQGLGRNEKFLPLNHGFDSWFGTVTWHSEACLSLQPKPREEFVNEALSVLFYGLIWSLFVVASLWFLCFLKAKFTFLSFIISVILYLTHNRTTYIMVKSCVLYRDRHIIAQPYYVENITLRFTDEALGFLETVDHKHPFFLMVNHLAVSRPLFNSPYFRNFSGRSDIFLDSLVELDWSVGSILKKIEHLNLTDDTIFIFTALSGENYNMMCNSLGCHGNEGCCHGNDLRGNFTLPGNWEKQLQVPLFIKWPRMAGHCKTINQTVTLMDVMPTILDLTNIPYFNETLDGKSVLGIMNGTLDLLHLYVFHYLDVTRPSAVTYNEYKVFYTTVTENGITYHDPPLVFNIRDDPDEIAPLPVENFREMITNISEAREKHVENRTRKWISQFEYPILPWLFPCANFPYCHRRDISTLKRIAFEN